MEGKREYHLEYVPYSSWNYRKVRIWKEQPEGLKNVWVRTIKANWDGARVVLGFSFIDEDGILKSKTKTLKIQSKFPRLVKLRTSVA